MLLSLQLVRGEGNVQWGEYTIYPREIEEVLYTNPGVMEAAVIGLPDKVLGELICACVKLKPDYVGGCRDTD